jgi:hypothetical protein
MQLAESGLCSEYNQRLRNARTDAPNPHKIYQVPTTPLFVRTCTKNPTEVLENTGEQGRGVQGHSGRPRSGVATPRQQRTADSGLGQRRRSALRPGGPTPTSSGRLNK